MYQHIDQLVNIVIHLAMLSGNTIKNQVANMGKQYETNTWQREQTCDFWFQVGFCGMIPRSIIHN